MPSTLGTTLRLPATTPLDRAFGLGRRAHPDLSLSFADFAARPGGDATPRAAADYYLARACDTGAPGAWEGLQAQYERRLLGFLRRRGATAAEAAQLLDETWSALAAPPPGGTARTRIGTYDGRGSLFAWLATIVWRALADRWRERSSKASTEIAARRAAVAPPDPASRVADAETARRLGLALEEAWSGLTARELQAVVLKYRFQMAQTEIARALGVGPPRVTRLLHGAMRRLRASIEARLGPQPSWDAPGGGWAGLFTTVERILARSAADVEPLRPGDSHDERP